MMSNPPKRAKRTGAAAAAAEGGAAAAAAEDGAAAAAAEDGAAAAAAVAADATCVDIDDYHYRYNCPTQTSTWLRNDNVCSGCLCYVCGVALCNCGVASHKFLGPHRLLDVDAMRMAPEQLPRPKPVTTDDMVGRLKSQGHLVLAVNRAVLTWDNDRKMTLAGCPTNVVDAAITAGILKPGHLAFSDFCFAPNSFKSMKSQVCQFYNRNHDMKSNTKPFVHALARLQESYVVGSHGFIFCLTRKSMRKHHELDLIVSLAHGRPFAVNEPPLGYHLDFTFNTAPDVGMDLSRLSDDRALLSNQQRTLPRLIGIEREGIGRQLWHWTNPVEDKVVYCTKSRLCRLLAVLPSGHVPDGPRYAGGLLMNERGMGKTMVMAALIAHESSETPPPPVEPMAVDLPRGYTGEAQLHTKTMPPQSAFDKSTVDYTYGIVMPRPLDDDDEPVLRVLPDVPTAKERRRVAMENKKATEQWHQSRWGRAVENWHASAGPFINTTLAVVPKVVIGQWMDELERMGLSVLLYYKDHNRTLSALQIEQTDVVVTTTETLARRVLHQVAPYDTTPPTHVLTVTHFRRLVVDECHLAFGSPASSTVRALAWVRARHRWGLTATPSRRDMRYYMRMLYGLWDARPEFDTSPPVSLTRALLSPSGSSAPINDMFGVNETRDVERPRTHEQMMHFKPPSAWREHYNDVHRKIIMGITGVVGRQRGGYLRAMVACINGTRSVSEEMCNVEASNVGLSPNALEVPPDITECAICLEPMFDHRNGGVVCGVRTDTPETRCHDHYFCRTCVEEWLRVSRSRCPLCRRSIDELQPCLMTALPEEPDPDEPSAALPPLVEKQAFVVNMVETLASTPAEDGLPNRVLLFSRHKEMRVAFMRQLGECGVTCTDVVAKFQSDSSYSVLVLSPQSCGVGINLMQANCVVLSEPSYRRATELQCIGRSARYGQTRLVNVYRCCTMGTVEVAMYRNNDKSSINVVDTFTSTELRESEEGEG